MRFGRFLSNILKSLFAGNIPLRPLYISAGGYGVLWNVCDFVVTSAADIGWSSNPFFYANEEIIPILED